MGLESELRGWALASGLQRSRAAVAAYRWLSTVRFRNQWDQPVEFRGARFSIGKDLTLYPAVHNGGFESHELDALMRRVRPEHTVWDVGANVGLYAVLLSRAASAGHVVAFEPVPASRERLDANLELNDCTNVTVEPIALSDHEGVSSMALYPDAPGCNRIIDPGELPAEAAGAMQISTATGDGYAQASRYGSPDVIKVDIEGHEPEFLSGSWDLVAALRPTIMLEVNPGTWVHEDRFETWTRLLAQLFDLYGYGDWYDTAGGSRVSSVDVRRLGPGPYTLILPAAPSPASA